ncbi:hypothetical protein LXL04_007340 [Taraxacum kok-saghyz]
MRFSLLNIHALFLSLSRVHRNPQNTFLSPQYTRWPHPPYFFLLLKSTLPLPQEIPLLSSDPTETMASSARDENVYMAKLAEQAERYEEMVEFMEKVSGALSGTDELNVEERNLLSVAYKNVIGSRRASWRIISSIEQKEESSGNEDHVSVIKGYRSKIEKQLSDICDGIFDTS